MILLSESQSQVSNAGHLDKLQAGCGALGISAVNPVN
jgi:hypothetical protein